MACVDPQVHGQILGDHLLDATLSGFIGAALAGIPSVALGILVGTMVVRAVRIQITRFE